MELPSSGIESERERLDELIRSTGAYRYSAEGFRLASGKTSKFYFDLRLLNGDPEGIHTVARIFYHHIKKIPGVQAVGGLESGSISIAAAISQLSHIENKKDPANPRIMSFFVRKEQKLHGTKKLVEGNIASPAVILDDVITSGKSAVSAVNAVKEAGCKCECLMSIIFRGGQDDYERIAKDVPLRYVFSKERFTEQPKPTAQLGTQLLFDEMYEGKSKEFRQLGYQATSVRELQNAGLKIHYDYSIIKHASEKKMILVTRDEENYNGCMENQIPCVKLGENPSNEDIIKQLEKLKDSV